MCRVNRRILLIVCAAVVLLGAGYVVFRSVSKKGESSSASASALRHAGTTSEGAHTGTDEPVTPDSKPDLRADLDSAWKNLSAGGTPQHIRSLLDELAAKLRGMTVGQRTIAIRDFLDSRRDAKTRLPFAIADGGLLDTAPSFRVWLLDQLGRANPDAAATCAQTVLGARESADEWAVALRNFAKVRTAPADVSYVNGKLRELLNEPRWQSEQSAGWLESFDVAVHTRAVELLPDLSRLLVRTGATDKPAAHASFLTMDRLVQSAPIETLGRLQSEPDLMKGRELTRANYFSRADVGNPQQREIVERYILNPSLSPDELAKFAGLFPNANMMISRNLLTVSPTPSREHIVAGDREALRVVDEWTKNPRFERVRPSLQVIRQRLAEFVRQTGE